MAKLYETVLIVDAMLPDDLIQGEFDAVQKMIEKDGKILKFDRWGKRKMAYEIKRRSHGDYGVFYYNAPGTLPAEMEKKFRINDNVLRWMTIADNPAGIPEDRKIDNDNFAPGPLEMKGDE